MCQKSHGQTKRDGVSVTEDTITEKLHIPLPELGEKLRRLREEKGVTQKALAKQCKMSLAKLRRVERGLVDEYAAVAKIAVALEITLVSLVDENLKCNRCGDCCRLFSIRIPIKSKKAVLRGPLLFYNLHENVSAAVELDEKGNRTIVVQIREKCSMLVEHFDGTTSCKLYWMRPPICRTFPVGLAKRGADTPQCSMMRQDNQEGLSIMEGQNG